MSRFARAGIPRRWIALVSFLGLSLPAAAQAGSDTVEIVQRYDLRRRVNGSYAGLFYGSCLSYWRLGEAAAGGSLEVSAHSYLMEESIKNLEKSEKTLKSEMESSFTLSSGWAVSDLVGGPAPLERGFPSLPERDAEVGDEWEAPAVLAVDPQGRGAWTRLKLIVSYRVAGRTRYLGREVLDIRAQYALRYARGNDPEGDPNLVSAEGRREATVYVDTQWMRPVFIRQKLSAERYRFSDGSSVENDGFILSFFSGGARLEEMRVSNREALEKALVDEGGIRLKDDARGLALSLEDLRFVADSPELLAGEDAKLGRIAGALASLPTASTFLVVGHTADVGSAESQQALSLERARRVSSALAASGLKPERFIVQGRGGTEPLGDDSTEEGRALNRRVEIILLD